MTNDECMVFAGILVVAMGFIVFYLITQEP